MKVLEPFSATTAADVVGRVSLSLSLSLLFFFLSHRMLLYVDIAGSGKRKAG